MRTSILSRSAIAVATLAIGSAALVAAPADAATSTGVTRDMVLTAVNGVRTAAATDSSWSTETGKALRSIVNRSCVVDYDADEYPYINDADPTAAGGSADGLLINAGVEFRTDEGWDYRSCIIGVVATSDASFVLEGTASLSVDSTPYGGELRAAPSPTVTRGLSGDVFVTPVASIPRDSYLTSATFTASGAASKVVTTKVATPKTAKQKKAAKSSYKKKLKSAKKAYKKAVDKAGKSKSKKTKAKKTYNKKKKSAKASYKKAVATSKIVKKTVRQPFTLSASENGGGPLM